HHEGDLGNIEAGQDGQATLDYLHPGLGFQGPPSLLGRGVIVPVKPHDFKTPPPRNAGARAACGGIRASQAARGPLGAADPPSLVQPGYSAGQLPVLTGGDLVRSEPPASAGAVLVGIDTEADDQWSEDGRKRLEVRNAERLPALQTLFDGFGV